MILVGLYTGLRLSDIAGLTWLNIDLENAGVNVVIGKTGRRQILPLAKPVMRYLEQLPSSDDPSAPLFPEAYAARQRSQNSGMLSNQFYEILAAAGLAKKKMHRSTDKGRTSRRELNDISFHSLRHTATVVSRMPGCPTSSPGTLSGTNPRRSAAITPTSTPKRNAGQSIRCRTCWRTDMKGKPSKPGNPAGAEATGLTSGKGATGSLSRQEENKQLHFLRPLTPGDPCVSYSI